MARILLAVLVLTGVPAQAGIRQGLIDCLLGIVSYASPSLSGSITRLQSPLGVISINTQTLSGTSYWLLEPGKSGEPIAQLTHWGRGFGSTDLVITNLTVEKHPNPEEAGRLLLFTVLARAGGSWGALTSLTLKLSSNTENGKGLSPYFHFQNAALLAEAKQLDERVKGSADPAAELRTFWQVRALEEKGYEVEVEGSGLMTRTDEKGHYFVKLRRKK